MKERVVVAFGGESVEHEISILSAMQVMAVLPQQRYEVIPLYIAKDGRMYSDDAFTELSLFEDLDAISECYAEVSLIRRESHYVLIPSHHRIFRREVEVDIVFPVLHGTYGEDGCFQGYLKSLRIPYVGCDVLGAAIGQDKVIMKQLLQEEGIPIVPWFHVSLYQKLDEAFFAKANRLGYPLIVKPANLGSSIGIMVAHDDVELHKALIEAFQYDHKVVVEKVITNLRELNCSVLGDEETCTCSVLEEVLKQDMILSYRDKYSGEEASKGMANASRLIPAEIKEDKKLEIQRYAKLTFQILQARGVSRIDFLLDQDNDEVYVNEINTIPGSLAYYLWEASGLSFLDLCEQLLAIARKTQRKEHKQIHSYQSNILSLKQGMKLHK